MLHSSGSEITLTPKSTEQKIEDEGVLPGTFEMSAQCGQLKVKNLEEAVSGHLTLFVFHLEVLSGLLRDYQRNSPLILLARRVILKYIQA